MASFSAELQVSEQAFPVIQCIYEVEQGTHQRRRVSTKVRYGLVQVVLDMPDSDTLLAWAAEPHKHLAVNILFHDSAGGSVIETLSLAMAYYVSYQEEFISGEKGVGAYRCFLTLSDPTGFTIQSVSPSTDFILPMAREHGKPPSEALKALSISASQVFHKNDADPLHDILGPGRLSHTQEWEDTIALLKSEGVDVVFRAGVMAYGP